MWKLWFDGSFRFGARSAEDGSGLRYGAVYFYLFSLAGFGIADGDTMIPTKRLVWASGLSDRESADAKEFFVWR